MKGDRYVAFGDRAGPYTVIERFPGESGADPGWVLERTVDGKREQRTVSYEDLANLKKWTRYPG